MKPKKVVLFLIATILILAVTVINMADVTIGNRRFPSVFDADYGIQRGLDLVGGSVIVFEADSASPSESDMQAVEQIMRTRLDNMGYFDAALSREGTSRIRVEIPNISDPEEAVQTVGATAKLTFTDYDGNVVMEGGTDIANAVYQYGPTSETGSSEHYVLLTLTGEGQAKFAQATAMAAQRPTGENVINIMLDDIVVSSPMVDQTINDNSCVITGNFEKEQAESLANQIQSGQLPFALKDVELRSVGPTLGERALESSLMAGAIGVLLVMIFMLLIYRLPGLVAVISLCLYMAVEFMIMAGYFTGDFKVTLTLPGVAGILLSIGMAVDANVVIFERIKEELMSGKTIRASIDSGFNRALTAVIDSNVTTIIAAVVLYIFGSGSIKGFALTLGIGIIVSMITAVFVSKFLLKMMEGFGVKNIFWYGVNKKKEKVLEGGVEE